MPDWLAILKAYVDTLETIVGTEGGVALADKLTAARAALLDQITAARMAELDAGNIPADVDTLKTYCDILDDAVNGLAAIKAEVEGLAGAAMRGTDGAALAASWTAALATALSAYTAAKAAFLDIAISSRAPGATALTNATWTDALATALSAYTAAKAAFIDVAISSRAPSATALSNAMWTDAKAGYLTAAVALASVCTEARLAELAAANLPADIDTLLVRLPAVLSAARIGYLDNINQAGLLQVTVARAGYLDELAAANIPADVDGLKTSRDRQLFSMDFWSVPQEEVAIPAVAATLALPSVVVGDLPAGATIVRAIAIVKFRMIENINVAANTLDGATVAATSQVIQVQDSGAAGWVDTINFVALQFGLAASTREGGDVLMGSIDIAVRVDANDTYSFRYLLAKAALLGINWNDMQCGLRIWYSV